MAIPSPARCALMHRRSQLALRFARKKSWHAQQPATELKGPVTDIAEAVPMLRKPLLTFPAGAKTGPVRVGHAAVDRSARSLQVW